MRIVHVLSDDLPVGELGQAALLRQQLAGDRFEFRVVAQGNGSSVSSGVDPMGCYPSIRARRWVLDPALVFRYLRLVRSFEPHLVHWWGTKGFATWMLERRLHLPVATLLNVCDTDPPVARATKYFSRWLASDLDVVVRSETSLETPRLEGLSRRSVSVIPYGAPAPTESTTVRSIQTQLGLAPSTVLVGAVGPLTPHARWKDLIWALDLLRVIHSEVHLLIIGEGREENSLRSFARACGCDDAVHFLHTRTHVTRILSQCICCWFSDPKTTFGRILPAMAAGVPVIVPDLPHLSDSEQQGRTGFCVPHGDSAEVARRTKLLLEDRTLAERLGAQGRDLAESAYPLDRMIEKFENLYQRAVRASSAA